MQGYERDSAQASEQLTQALADVKAAEQSLDSARAEQVDC